MESFIKTVMKKSGIFSTCSLQNSNSKTLLFVNNNNVNKFHINPLRSFASFIGKNPQNNKNNLIYNGNCKIYSINGSNYTANAHTTKNNIVQPLNNGENKMNLSLFKNHKDMQLSTDSVNNNINNRTDLIQRPIIPSSRPYIFARPA